MTNKVTSMHDAIAQHVQDGMSVAIEGFTAFICFAAGHEIIRQQRRDLTLIRMTPDILYDQMIAAGVARKLVFSYLGNPGVGPLHAIRRAVEQGVPAPLEIEEYSHYGMVGRYVAGASHLPFYPLRSYVGSDMPQVNPRIQWVESPYGDGKVAVVPPLNPDVAIIHAQRADAQGNTQLWGLLGVQKEVAFAARKVIVVVEEIVEESVIRADPNRTLIPGLIVSAVVHEPYGAHPSYAQGYYDRDNAFYLLWDELSRDRARTDAWLQEWVHDVPDRAAYLRKLGDETLQRLHPAPAPAGVVDYGEYG
jgi:glutaconate CoA-transferase subunit A